MSLYRYLVRLEAVIRSRSDIELERLQITVVTFGAVFAGDLRFHDGSRLSIVEQLESRGRREYRRIAHKYHYQDREGKLVFRYDNSPHYPELSTFPDHKHLGSAVTESEPPDLTNVLAEIDAHIYPAPPIG